MDHNVNILPVVHSDIFPDTKTEQELDEILKELLPKPSIQKNSLPKEIEILAVEYIEIVNFIVATPELYKFTGKIP